MFKNLTLVLLVFCLIFFMGTTGMVAQDTVSQLTIGSSLIDELSINEAQKCYEVSPDPNRPEFEGFTVKLTSLSSVDLTLSLYGRNEVIQTWQSILLPPNIGNDSLTWLFRWGVYGSLNESLGLRFNPAVMQTYSEFLICVVEATSISQTREYRIYFDESPSFPTYPDGLYPFVARAYWSIPVRGCVLDPNSLDATGLEAQGIFMSPNNVFYFEVLPDVGGRYIWFTVEPISSSLILNLSRTLAEQLPVDSWYDAKPSGQGYAVTVTATQGAGCYTLTIHSTNETD